jgi:hypothetical protein
MPTITINAEVAGPEDCVSVNVFVNQEHCARLGPFKDWQQAHRKASTIVENALQHLKPLLDELRQSAEITK